MKSNSKQNRPKTQNTERQKKKVFLKEQVENADLYKSILKKITTNTDNT